MLSLALLRCRSTLDLVIIILDYDTSANIVLISRNFVFRELDKRNLIQSDPFILMSGDVVTNVNIVPALKEHEKRHKKDNSSIMTVLLKNIGTWNVHATKEDNNLHSNKGDSAYDSGDGIDESIDRGKSNGTTSSFANHHSYTTSVLQSFKEDLTVALSPSDNAGNRILLYDGTSNPNNSNISLPTSFIETNSRIDVRNDLLDTGIYICSPEVLARFSDEFDYLSISKFISNSVAEEEEGLQNKIHASLLRPNEYAARIHDPRTYHEVSMDLLKRWCYPLVPDNLPSGYEKIYRYDMHRRLVYVEKKKGGTKMGRSSDIIGPCLVGSACFVGEDCVVKVSSISISYLVLSVEMSFIWKLTS